MGGHRVNYNRLKSYIIFGSRYQCLVCQLSGQLLERHTASAASYLVSFVSCLVSSLLAAWPGLPAVWSVLSAARPAVLFSQCRPLCAGPLNPFCYLHIHINFISLSVPFYFNVFL